MSLVFSPARSITRGKLYQILALRSYEF
jgi:hypothetical protein